MNIAYINPPYRDYYSRNQRSPAVTKGGTLYYPIWLAYACGWAKKHKLNATLFDFIASKTSHENAKQILKRYKPDVLVIDIVTASAINDIQFAEDMAGRFPKSTVVLVGPHPSALYQEILTHSRNITVIAIGEYDQTIVELAKAITKKCPLTSVAGLILKKGKRIVKTSPRAPLTGKELDEFPFISQIYKQHLHIPDYYFAAARHPMLMMITGRGCPFACNFCIYWQTLHGKVYRARSPENVAAEFAYIAKHLPEVKEIVIEDDTFTADRNRVREICKLLIAQHNTLPWSANVRVGIDYETLRFMKQAGCRLIIVGFESGEQKLLDSMGKHATVAMAYDLMRDTKKAGILVHGCFMVGNPGETRETMKKTLSHAIRLNPDSAQFYPLYLYPGTISYLWYEQNKLLKTKDWSKWLKADGEHNTTFDLPGLTSSDLVDFCEKAYITYYLRPAYLISKIFQLFKDPDEAFRSLHSAANYIRTKLLLQ